MLSQPDVVGTLIHLKELWVDYNRLMKLPKVRLLKNIAFFSVNPLYISAKGLKKKTTIVYTLQVAQTVATSKIILSFPVPCHVSLISVLIQYR